LDVSIEDLSHTRTVVFEASIEVVISVYTSLLVLRRLHEGDQVIRAYKSSKQVCHQHDSVERKKLLCFGLPLPLLSMRTSWYFKPGSRSAGVTVVQAILGIRVLYDL
jgi:hypothetical protein